MMNPETQHAPLDFDKWSGAGNDFVIFDNRDGKLSSIMAELAQKVCQRHVSLGADGVIYIEQSMRGHIRARFFNPDGSEFNMCINGSRCVARHAFMHVMAPKKMIIETNIGNINAEVDRERVLISFSRQYKLELHKSIVLDKKTLRYHFVKIGDPHIIVPIKNVTSISVQRLGKILRNHEQFAPEGVNVNFVHFTKEFIYIRTYERGVEAETYACGSGCVSTALSLSHLGYHQPQYVFLTRSGSLLRVRIEWGADRAERIFVEGDARWIASGKLQPESWDYPGVMPWPL